MWSCMLCKGIQHQGTTSSDINIEEKLHISLTNWISFSDEAVFRLLQFVCDQCLYSLTLLALKFTDEILLIHLSGRDGLESVWVRYFKKEARASRNVWTSGILCSVWTRVSRMRNTPKKQDRKREDLSNACSNIPLRMSIAGFLWNSWQDKKHPLLSTSKNNENYQGQKCLSFHYNLWEQAAEQARLAHPPSYLTEVTGASLNVCQLRQMKRKQAWAPCIHWCLEIADCCGSEWKLLPPKP